MLGAQANSLDAGIAAPGLVAAPPVVGTGPADVAVVPPASELRPGRRFEMLLPLISIARASSSREDDGGLVGVLPW